MNILALRLVVVCDIHLLNDDILWSLGNEHLKGVNEMPNDKNVRHPHDGKRIDIHDPAEVRNWCAIFGVNEAKLRAAVQAVGTSSTAVRQWLGK